MAGSRNESAAQNPRVPRPRERSENPGPRSKRGPMPEYQTVIVLASFAFFYSIVGARLEKTPVNGALVYVVVGILCGPHGFRLVDFDVDAEGIRWLAELTLAVVLFTDSANANLTVLRRFEMIPLRLLLIGLPLTMLAGFGAGVLLLPELSLVEVALLAALLAPTDAALGQAVVTNVAVPSGVRESLNVESGLNDGICVPVVLLLLAVTEGRVEGNETVTLAIQLHLKAIGIGVLVGVALGFVGSIVLRLSLKRKWTAEPWMQLPVAALAILCFALSQWLRGSGFIAAFVAGMTFGALMHERKAALLEGAEGAGDLLAMFTWFTFGTMLSVSPFTGFTWQMAVYAIVSLTVVRMLAVWLSVTGMGLRVDTRLFLGWFGPRGLASIVFAVMVVQAKLPGGRILAATAALTILASVVTHGLSATPLANVYGRRVGKTRI